MSKSYKDMFNSNKDNNTSNKFKSNKKSTFDMFSINVSKAEKDTKQVFDYAKSQLTDYEKLTAKSVSRITAMYSSSYKNMYNDLSNQHKSYLNDLIKREIATANEISNIWNSVDRSGNNNNTNRESNNLFNESSNSNNSSNTNKSNKVIDSLSDASNNLNDTTKNLDTSNLENSKRISSAAKSINIAAKVIVGGLQKYANIWIDRFFDGIDRIVNTYEDTYQTVSSLMDINQSQYADIQTRALDKIKDLNLDNNIAISSVMKELDTVVKLGITGKDAENKALSDSITKAINPFIETTSDAYIDLQSKLGSKFVTTMNGMAQSVTEVAGSSRFMQRNINDILTSLEPIVLNAKSDYADKVLGPMVQQLETFVDNGTMTQSEAEKLKQSALDMTLNPYEALTNGSVVTRTAASKVADSGGDFTDAYSNLQALLNSEVDLQKSVTPGTLDASAVANAYGSNTSYVTDKNKIVQDMANSKKSSSYDKGKKAEEDLANDKYTTDKQQHEILAENTSLKLAQFRQQYPDAYAVLESMSGTLIDILKSVTGNFISRIGSNIVSKFMSRGAGEALGKTVGDSLSKSVISGTSSTYGSKLAYGLSQMGGGSTGIGIARASGAIAGGLIAAKGISNTIDGVSTLTNDHETSHNKKLAGVEVAGGTVATIGGIAGAGMLLASNPVGWIALTVGGLGLAASQVAKNFKTLDKNTEAVNTKLDKQAKNIRTHGTRASNNLKNSSNNNKKSAESAREALNSKNEDTMRSTAISLGLIDENEAKNTSYDELKTLLEKAETDEWHDWQENANSSNTISRAAGVDNANILKSSATDLKQSTIDKDSKEVRKKFYDLIQKSKDSKGKLDKSSDSYKQAEDLVAKAGVNHDDFEDLAEIAAKGTKDFNDKKNKDYTELSKITDSLGEKAKDTKAYSKAVSDINKDYNLKLDNIKSDKDYDISAYNTNLQTYVVLRSKQIAYDNLNSKLDDDADKYELTDAQQKELDSSKAVLLQYLTPEELTGEDKGNSSAKAKIADKNISSLDSNIRSYVDFEMSNGNDGNLKDYSSLNDNNGVNDDNYNYYKTRSNKIPGTYATGISYVPNDQIAKIHKGEAVLNKSDARKYRQHKATIAKNYTEYDKLKNRHKNEDSLLKKSDNYANNKEFHNKSDASRSDLLTAINNGIARLVDTINKISSSNESPSNITNKNHLSSRVKSNFDNDIINLKTTTTAKIR